MSRSPTVRLLLAVIAAALVGVLAGYLLRSSRSPSIEERARGAVEYMKGALERVTK